MITVVGAGLVGSLLSIFLSRRGHSVRLIERRPDMRKKGEGEGRSINLAVSVRGIHALSQIGLDSTVLRQAVAMRGRLMHSVKGELTFQRYGKDDSECIYSISRAGLNRTLLSEAEKAGAILSFDRRISGTDLEALKTESECIFGTDGAGSAVREALEAQGICRSTETALDYGYKELVIPPTPAGEFAFTEKNALHIWPRGKFMLIALPNFDGSFTATLFLPFKGSPSFEALGSPAEVRAFFEVQFPDALPVIPNLEAQFFEHPTGSMVTVKCSPWNQGGKALVLGDAAHAIVPFFGQGMNAGFEDVTLLDERMASHEPWDKMFPAFSSHRKVDTDAIADMAVENFEEMRDKVGDPNFLFEKEVEKVLQRKFPEDYVSRYQLVTFSRVPYRRALEAGVAQGRILARLCHGLNRPEDVDLEQARLFIEAELRPVLKGVQ